MTIRNEHGQTVAMCITAYDNGERVRMAFVQTYKGVDIYQNPKTGHCSFNRNFALSVMRAKAKIDGIL